MHMHLPPARRRRASAFLAALMLAASLPAAGAGAPLMSPEDLEQKVLEPMEHGFALYRQAARAVPREGFDPRAKMDILEKDPEAAFSWVRDQTALLDYAGTLRGARGTLMERAGNSLDRVLLLDALLEHGGVENRRLVRIRIGEDAAAGLHSFWAEHADFRHPEDADAGDFDLDGTVLQVAEDTGEDPEVLRRELQNALVRQELLRAELSASVQLQADMLREALPLNPDADDAPSASALRDHWYLEAEIGGAWQAFDPARRDHAPGDTLPGEHVARFATGDLPQDVHHRVGVAVISEQWEGGTLRESTLLSHEFAVTGLQDPHFTVQMIPPRNHPLENVLSRDLSPGEILENVTGVDEWLPVLRVDGESVMQFSVRANGDVNENPEAPPQVRALGDAAGLLGGLGRGGRQAEAVKELTAVRMDIILHAPGEDPEILSRYFTDILGPARRQSGAEGWSADARARQERALALLGGITVTPVTHSPHPDWVNLQKFRSTLENRDAYLQVIGGALKNNMTEVEQGFTGLRRHPVDLYHIAAERTRLHPEGLITQVDGVNLIARAETLALNAAGDGLIAVRMYDWIRNSVRARPSAPSPRRAVFLQGIVDTHAEEFLTRNDDAPDNLRLNTARQYGDDLLAGVSWVRVADADALAPLADQFNEDELTRFRASLAAGHHLLIRPEVLLPADGAMRAPVWWTFNPETGGIIGHGLDERGMSTEYAIKLATIVFTLIDGTIGAVLCANKKGWALACCLAEVAIRSGAGIVLGFGIASKFSAVTAYYIGVGFSATSAATGWFSILGCS